MAEPVLVIHGVGNPERAPFQAVVGRLQKVVGKDYDLIDVFWGDLGAGRLGFADTVPDIGADDEEESVGTASLALPPAAGGPSDLERAAVIAAAARPSELETVDPLLTAIILEQLQSTVHLRTVCSAEVLAMTGELIAESAAVAESGSDEEGLVGGLGWAAGRVMRHVDRLLGAAVGETLGRVNQALRNQLVPAAAGFFGDVLAGSVAPTP